MRLLRCDSQGQLTLTENLDTPPAYAILSHTWGADDDEVTFDNLEKKTGMHKAGYDKLWFCARQAAKDGLDYCWVDTCCINKANHSELSEAITSMFRFYQGAARCYVYLSDLSVTTNSPPVMCHEWESTFSQSRWHTRGWTLQELLAPASVEFFSKEGQLLGTKRTLEGLIHSITSLPVAALRGISLSTFTVDERFQWIKDRKTKKVEDRAYCLLGIFGVFMPLIYGEGKHAETRLREHIKKGADGTPSSIHTYWTVTRAPNSLFTGREDILQELSSAISDALANPPHQDQCRIVVSGMGGQGKSEICLQLAHRFRQSFWGVFWIDVSSTSLAERSLQKLAQMLSLSAQTWEEACLGIANLKDPWLLVLDNADDPDLDYQLYIPSSPQGVVLLTSRNQECEQYTTNMATRLEGLSVEAACELLLNASRVPARQHRALEADAIRVAALLQSHPLALIQAGAYISRGHCRLDQYPAEYERQRRRLLQFHPAQAQSRYQDVCATFEASADAMKQSAAIAVDDVRRQSAAVAAGDALELLPLLAVCGPNQLPLAIFQWGWKGTHLVSPERVDDAEDDSVKLLTPWHVAQLPELLGTSDGIWDSYRLVEAVQVLKAFALVSNDGAVDSMTVSMHPLVHAWARDRQHEKEQHTRWLSMACVIAFAWKAGVSHLLYRQTQPHVESIVEWDMDTMFASGSSALVSRVLVSCGWLLHEMRGDNQVALLVARLLAYLHLDATTAAPAWLGLFDLVGQNLAQCGRPQQAINLLRQVVQLQGKSLAADHSDRLKSQKELAAAYLANGQVKEALELLEEVVQIESQLLAADHPDRLTSQHELARAYHANGQVKEAVELLEEVVQIRSQSLAADHPDRLTSQHELAGAYLANGQVKETIELLEEVVQIESQLLAADHPDRLTSQHELARAYHANGQVKEAVELLEEVVQIRSQSLAADHPDRLTSQHELAGAYLANGQVKETIELLEEVVQIRSQSLAADHPDRLASQHELARAYLANGQVKEAVELLEEVVQIQSQSLAADHPDRLTSQHELAGAYLANGQVKETIELLEEVVQIRSQSLAADHPDRLASQHELARAYHANGQVKETIELLEEVVQIQSQSLAANHPDRLLSEHNLAAYLWKLGQHQRAHAIMDHVVTIRKQALDERHPDRLGSEGWLEHMELEMEQFEQPEETLESEEREME